MSTDHSSSADDASHSSNKKTSVLDSLKSAGGSFKRFVTHSSLQESQKDDLNKALHRDGEKKAELEKYRDFKATFEQMKKVDAAYAANEALSVLNGKPSMRESKTKSGLDDKEDKKSVAQQQLDKLNFVANQIKEMEKQNPLIKKELEYAQRHGEVDKVKKAAAVEGKSSSLRDTLKGAVGMNTDHRQASPRQTRL